MHVVHVFVEYELGPTNIGRNLSLDNLSAGLFASTNKLNKELLPAALFTYKSLPQQSKFYSYSESDQLLLFFLSGRLVGPSVCPSPARRLVYARPSVRPSVCLSVSELDLLNQGQPTNQGWWWQQEKMPRN